MSDLPEPHTAWIALPGDQDSPELTRITRPWRRAGRATPAVIAVMKHSANQIMVA